MMRGRARTRVLGLGLVAVLALGFLPACAGDTSPGGPSTSAGSASATPPPTPPPTAAAGLAITPLGMVYVNDISHDANWVVGNEPREPGANEQKPLVLMNRATGEQTVLCDWADEDLGFCSLAEQGGMIPETPTLLVDQVATSVVGWFPSGGVYLVDSVTGTRTRIDTDSAGVPLEPAWKARKCEGGCDYHWAPRLNVSADSVSGDGRIAALCTDYEEPKEPVLYVKDLGTGELIRTGVPCGINRFGREDDDDEFNDEGMSYPQISADGTVVHVDGDRSSGGEYGKVGWAQDALYFPATREVRGIDGSGGMTRDGRTVFLRRGVQAEAPEADVVPEYAAYDVATGEVDSVALDAGVRQHARHAQLPVRHLPPGQRRRSAGGEPRLRPRCLSGAETDIGALLQEAGLEPSTGDGPLRISGDGTVVLANVVGPDPLRRVEQSSRRCQRVGGRLTSCWAPPTQRATLPGRRKS